MSKLNSNDAMVYALAMMSPDRVDKGGNAYVIHLMSVATMVAAAGAEIESKRTSKDELVQAAILHDTIEDTDATLDDLRAHGFSARVVEMVDALTRRDGENYVDYLMRCAEDNEAWAIKAADAMDNADLTRLREIDEAAIRRLRKYLTVSQIGQADTPEETGGAVLALISELAAQSLLKPDEIEPLLRKLVCSLLVSRGLLPKDGAASPSEDDVKRVKSILALESAAVHDRVNAAVRRALVEKAPPPATTPKG